MRPPAAGQADGKVRSCRHWVKGAGFYVVDGGRVLTSERLPSGLQLVVEPRSAAPVVAMWLRVGIGALNEAAGHEGAAHFVEHMLFKGSRRPGSTRGLRPGEIGPLMDAIGADLNAYTTHEETVVHCVLPRAHAQEALRLMGELVFRCWFQPEELARERLVVLDEIARNRDEPTRVLGDAIARRAWGRHPYGRSVLGTPSSIGELDVSALTAFHRRWYHPANASLVVVGDIDTAAVKKAANEMVAEARPGSGRWMEPNPPRPAAPARELGFVRITGSFEEQILELAMRVPGHGHPDLPAIDLLCSALGEGASAILPERLHLRSALAHEAWAVTDIGSVGGLLICGASPAKDDPGQLLEALGAALRDIREAGLPVQSFQRAKASILADRAYADETAEGRASVLSWYLGHYGSAHEEQRYRGTVEALRLRDVQRAARLYLWPEKGTVGLMGQDVCLSRGDARALLAPRKRQLRRPAPTERAVVRKVVGPGVRVLVESRPEASVTAVRALSLGGTMVENPASAGHSRAWADLLAEGAGHLDASAYASAVEGLSGSVCGFSSLSLAGLSAAFPSDRFPVALHLAVLPLLAPRFDDDAVDRVKSGLVDAVRTRGDSGSAVAWDSMFELAFPGHPYRLPGMGSEKSLARIDAAAMRRQHRRVVRGESMVIAVSGAVSPDDVFRSLERLLAGLPGGKVSRPAPPRSGLPRRRQRFLDGSWQQAQLVVGFQGCHALHPDCPALDVLGALLGSPGGRLFQRLREEEGLSYDIQAFHLSALQGGLMACALGTAHGRLIEAARALRVSLHELRASPPDQEERDRAVAALTGGAAMDMQRAAYRAQRMAQDECFGLDGRAFRRAARDIERVSLAQLLAVARTYLDPARALRVVARRTPSGR